MNKEIRKLVYDKYNGCCAYCVSRDTDEQLMELLKRRGVFEDDN